MKLRLTAVCLFFLILPGAAPDWAQTPSGGASTSITPEQKAEFMRVRKQVLDDNPDLKAEQDQLTQQKQSVKDGSPDDKKAFFQSMMAHQKKMKEAMLKIDPTLGPVFDQMQQQMRQKMQQRMGGGGDT